MKFERTEKFLVSSSLGTYLEYLDFSLYSAASGIIATYFFSSHNESLALILTWVTFAIGFVVRPLGAVVFGHIGDRMGCKVAMILSICLMSLSTVCIGLLPSFEQIGYSASIILVLLRVIQGLAVSSEYNGAGTYLSLDPKLKSKYGVLCSLTVIAALTGLLTGNFIISQTTAGYDIKAVPELNWRLPFIISGIFVFITGLYLRMSMHKGMPAKRVKIPVISVLRSQKSEVVLCILISAFAGVATYTILSFLPSYLREHFSFSLKDALMTSNYYCLLIIAMAALSGWISDRIGRLALMKFSALIMVIYCILFIVLETSTLTFFHIKMTFLAVATGFFVGPLPAVLSEVFRQEQRYTGSALGYNIGLGWLGGTAPMVISLLSQSLHQNVLIILYPSIFALFAYLAISFYEKSRKPALNSLYEEDISLNSIDLQGAFKDGYK